MVSITPKSYKLPILHLSMNNETLIFDWNSFDLNSQVLEKEVQLDDESLRDGLQSPSTQDPPLEYKLKLVRLMEDLQINGADIGFPSSTKKMYDDVTAICEMIRDEGFNLAPNCAARTIAHDIEPVIDISHKVGIPLEVAAFLGSSPIRMKVESWSLEKLLRLTKDATRLCIDNNVPIMFVTEDTTRADPKVLEKIYLTAVENGAQAICLSDTVGHATPHGTYQLVSYIKHMLKENGFSKVRVDWHGHRDRGLSLANSIAAIEAGIDRVHGTGIGIGERCGNTPMDTLLVNLKLMGFKNYKNRDLSKLSAYTETVSEMVKFDIPKNYPVMGTDAFRTATGVHAAAIIKAQTKDESWGDIVYSSVPAKEFGKEQIIDIGPLSGISNARFVLEKLGIDCTEENCRIVLDFAKENGKVLSEIEVSHLFPSTS